MKMGERIRNEIFVRWKKEKKNKDKGQRTDRLLNARCVNLFLVELLFKMRRQPYFTQRSLFCKYQLTVKHFIELVR